MKKIEIPFTKTYTTTVRYAETDRMGVAHHASYLLWMEEARTHLMRKMGFPYSKLESMGVFLPVVEAYVRYIKGLDYEQSVEVYTSALVFARKIRIDYIIKSNDEEIARGYTVHLAVNKNGKIASLPQEFLEKAKNFKCRSST